MKDLKARFFPTPLLAAMSIIQPQYYRDIKLKRSRFDAHFKELLDFYCTPRRVGELTVLAIIDSEKLELDANFFYDHMCEMCNMFESTDDVWLNIDRSPSVHGRMPSMVRLGHLLLSLPSSSIPNERRFSLMNPIKSELRNKLLPKHMNACIRMSCSRYSLDTFPFADAYQQWQSNATRYMCNGDK